MDAKDPKIAELERKVVFLENLVKQLAGRVDYMDRERIRTKNSLNTLSNEVKKR
jgi:hypothetical protein